MAFEWRRQDKVAYTDFQIWHFIQFQQIAGYKQKFFSVLEVEVQLLSSS